jgi:hypothetical protein
MNITTAGCGISGLTRGKKYVLAVRYRNKVGWGPYALSPPVTIR